MRRTTIWSAGLAGLVLAAGGWASSHREAPFITEHPKVDGTDFYMFRSYETGRGAFTTLIANYLPLQDAYGGPNYFSLDSEALYEIHIDNNGDAQEDITFQFQFTNTLSDHTLNVGGVDVSIPLINKGTITSDNDPDLNVRETYTVTQVLGDRRTGAKSSVTNAAGGSTTFTKPVDFIGKKSFGGGGAPYTAYQNYANSFIYNVNIPGCGTQGKLFVGQRQEPFPVNLGVIFDLVDAVPIDNVANPGSPTNCAGTGGLPRKNPPSNIVANKNITTFALEVPTSCLTGTGDIIAGWTTSSLRQGKVLNPSPIGNANPALAKKPAVEGGAWTQVSRLGNPLVNEVVIGLKDKDRFNASEPKDDAQFATYVTNPTLPELLEALFGAAATAPDLNPFARTDLVDVFLTGLQLPPVDLRDGATAEMLRLDTGIAPTTQANQAANPNFNLGMIGGDLAGFPNGRRPADDVVDIALRVIMGKVANVQGKCVAPATCPCADTNYTDAASFDANDFQATFPYLNTPIPGSP